MVDVLLALWKGQHDRRLKQFGFGTWEGPLWQGSAMAAFMLTQFSLDTHGSVQAVDALLRPPKFWDSPHVINAAAHALVELGGVEQLEQQLEDIRVDGISGREADYLKLLNRRTKVILRQSFKAKARVR